jgi:hypothetical protein
VSGVVLGHYNAGARGQGVDLQVLSDDINKARIVNISSFAAFAGIGVLGIIQAQVAFVPERTVIRTRSIPPRPKAPDVMPTVSGVPGGAMFGLVGHF